LRTIDSTGDVLLLAASSRLLPGDGGSGRRNIDGAWIWDASMTLAAGSDSREPILRGVRLSVGPDRLPL
jgi:hypothetical protein